MAAYDWPLQVVAAIVWIAVDSVVPALAAAGVVLMPCLWQPVIRHVRVVYPAGSAVHSRLCPVLLCHDGLVCPDWAHAAVCPVPLPRGSVG